MKIDVKETGYERVKWIYLAETRPRSTLMWKP